MLVFIFALVALILGAVAVFVNDHRLTAAGVVLLAGAVLLGTAVLA